MGSSVLVGRLEVAGSSLPTPAGGTFHGCQVAVPPFATQSNWWAFEFCHILNCILIRWGSILSHHVYHNNKKNNGLGCFVKGPRCPIHLVFRTKLKSTIGTHDSRLVTNLGYLWHLYPPEKSTNFREYVHFSCLSMQCPRVEFHSRILRY